MGGMEVKKMDYETMYLQMREMYLKCMEERLAEIRASVAERTKRIEEADGRLAEIAVQAPHPLGCHCARTDDKDGDLKAPTSTKQTSISPSEAGVG